MPVPAIVGVVHASRPPGTYFSALCPLWPGFSNCIEVSNNKETPNDVGISEKLG